MKQMIMAAAITLVGSFAFAQSEENLGQKCPSFEKKAFMACLQSESAKIPESNIENEVIYSTTALSRKSALALVGHRNSEIHLARQKQVLRSIAMVVIVQYNDDPQMFYYTVSVDGQLEYLMDMNIYDMPYFFPHLKNDPTIFYLKAKMASDVIKEIVNDLSFDEN